MSIEDFIQKRLRIEEVSAAKVQGDADAGGYSSRVNIVNEKKMQAAELVNSQKEPISKSNSANKTLKVKNKQLPAKKKAANAKPHPGRRGDPRMQLAVQAKINDPNISLIDALVAGGFVFPGLDKPGVQVANIEDTDGVSVYQRRNQLLRRLRLLKDKSK